MLFRFASFVLSLVASFTLVKGHGRLMEPPNRSSLWRFPDDPMIEPYLSLIEPNYNDNQLFCGGAQYQESRGGKCGVCGDPVDAQNPENVPPGKYAKGIIVRQYQEGSTIPVTVELTTHHKGYFEFRLCPWNDVKSPVTHECLNKHILTFPKKESTRYDVSSEVKPTYDFTIQLPDGITCDQCVLQWRYHTGNTWGCDAQNDCGTGKGPQEEFYGCADIAIGTNSVIPPPQSGGDGNTVTTSTSTAATDQQSSTSSSSTTTSTSTTSSTSTSSGPSTTTSSAGSSNENSVCNGNENGYVKIDCYSFYRCSNGIPYKIDCSAGTLFDETTNRCDYEHIVNCT